MACRRPGDKPLSEPMMVSLLTHICVTRPQWVDRATPTDMCAFIIPGPYVSSQPWPYATWTAWKLPSCSTLTSTGYWQKWIVRWGQVCSNITQEHWSHLARTVLYFFVLFLCVCVSTKGLNCLNGVLFFLLCNNKIHYNINSLRPSDAYIRR